MRRHRTTALAVLLLAPLRAWAGDPVVAATRPPAATDPCKGKVESGWHELTSGSPVSGEVGWMSARLEGAAVTIGSPGGAKRYQLCRDKWEDAPAAAPALPGDGVDLGGARVIAGYEPAESSYDFFSSAHFRLPSGKTLGPFPKNAPGPRTDYALAFTGTAFVVWGGWGPSADHKTYGPRNDGAVLDVETGTWRTIAGKGAPSARYLPAVAWTGSRLLVWGGASASGPGGQPVLLGDGASYDPVANSWKAISATNAPPPRLKPVTVWTGAELLILGGGPQAMAGGARGQNDAFLYDPAADAWREASGAPAVNERQWVHTFVDDARNVVVVDTFRLTVAQLDAASHAFVDVHLPPTLAGRSGTAVAWTGRRVLLFGGFRAQPYDDPCRGAGRPCDPPPPNYSRFADAWSFTVR